MPIQPHIIVDARTQWQVSLSPGGTLHKENKCKYNWQKNSRACHIVGCNNPVRINSPSGRCTEHFLHTEDIRLQVSPPNGTWGAHFPSHVEIIEKLIEWASTRNYHLEHFFEELAFNLLGNIPDVTMLDGKYSLNQHQPSIQYLIDTHMMSVVDSFFPESNSSSYQMLNTREGSFPVRILATILAGLVLCEEANRGDRWFCRNIMQKEEETTQLGGAMPLIHFAARRFKWGVEMKSVLKHVLR